ncbi:ERF family protein [Pseudochelatococcus contaminans]|nr:ERF family protein [Pseudochelatococcus contaminans]
MALDPNIDPDRIERFIDLKERMEQRAAERAYSEAFAAMTPNLPAISRRGKGHNNTQYAKWEDIQDGIIPIISRHGFGLSFKIAQNNNTVTVTATLLHNGGHKDSTDFVTAPDKGPGRNDIQAIGSAISYGKRYAACALLNIRVAGEDDDGRKAGLTGDDVKPISAEQLSELQRALGDTGTDIARFCRFHKIDALPDLPAAKLASAIAGIKRAASERATRGASR